jgi:tellurite resistance protein TehA-like permease
VSVALLLDGQDALSTIVLVIACVSWVVLAVLLPARAVADRERFSTESHRPAALTSVAGTAVLGARLTLAGADWAGVALLIIATALWVGLVPGVLRNWETPTTGASFILTVGTESLTVLAATLSLTEHADWLLYLALVPFALGLCFYVMVMTRFDARQLGVGVGDHWVTGGALAISTLSAGRIALGAQGNRVLGGAHGPLETITLVLWCLTMAWLPLLLLAEVLRPRLTYNVRRWSTVFPFGMYAACSFTAGAVTQISGITDFARVWVWVALVVWLAAFTAMLRRAPGLVQPPSVVARAA